MNFSEFVVLITEEIRNNHDEEQSNFSPRISKLLKLINTIPKDKDSIMMTQLTILFEGFYSNFKDTLLFSLLFGLRVKRWENHESVPTVTFLIVYAKEINKVKQYFELGYDINSDRHSKFSDPYPWLVIFRNEKDLLADEPNNLVYEIDQVRSAYEDLVIPPEIEKSGAFQKTYNPMGGFAMAPTDEFSIKFFEDASQVYLAGGCVLDIGTGFGSAVINLFNKEPGSGLVYVNDINPLNLAVVAKRLAIRRGVSIDVAQLTGDGSDLRCLAAEFPRELAGISDGSIDVILISRVLHFLKGEVIDDSLILLAKKLKPGGRIYIICETPYLSNWKNFLPIYEENCRRGLQWPGEVETVKYESSGRSTALPPFMHLLDQDILKNVLTKNGYEIVSINYINRHGFFPSDLLLDGRESVGVHAFIRNSV